MPRPTVSDVHVNRLLTNMSIAYTNPEYIADKAFPILPVTKQTDVYASYDQSHWFRDEVVLRAPGTEPQAADYAVTLTNTYHCPGWSLSRVLPDEVLDNADAPLNLEAEAVNFLTDKMLMKREVKFATDYFATGKWTTDKTGGTDFTVWSNYAGSNPIVDLDTYKDTVEALIGREPNVFIMGKQVWLQLKNHPDFLDNIKYTQRGQMSVDLFASLAGFETVHIGRAIRTTDKEGTAEASVTYSRIWGKNGLMIYRPAAPSLMTPSAGYNFVWQRVPSALQYIVTSRDERKQAKFVDIHSYFSQTQTSANAGLFLSGAVA